MKMVLIVRSLHESYVMQGVNSCFHVSAPQLIYGAKVDYIVFDYLSEITMSLLTAAKSKHPV